MVETIEKGVCPACKNKRRIRKTDGLIETHARAGNNYDAARCKGSLQRPAASEGEENV